MNRAAAARSRTRWAYSRCVVSTLVGVALVSAAGAGPGQARPLTTQGIVFESTRDGNSEIYLMTVDGGVQLRLTNDPALDVAPAIAPDGQIAFASSRDGNWNIFTTGSRGGIPGHMTSSPAIDFGPVWSPDGQTVVFTRSSPDPGLSELHLLDRSTGKERPMTNLPGQNFAPTFAPTGDRVAFVHGEKKRFHIQVATLDGAVQADLSARTGHNADFDPVWSPNGDQIAFSRRDAKGNYDVWTMDVATARERRLTSAKLEDSSPTWSPDARQLAFVRGGDGAYEIYVMNADGSGQHDLTNSVAGADVAPKWGANVGLARARAFAAATAPSTKAGPAATGFFCTKIGTRRADS